MDGLHTIISANIRFDNPEDGVLCWEMRLPLLAQLIQSHSPLIVGTQEGRRTQHQELLQALRPLSLCDAHRPWLEERMYPCIYLDQSRAHLDQSGDVWLSASPETPGTKLSGSAFPRLCTWARLRVSARTLFIINLHLDFLAEDIRLQQARILAAEIRPRLGPNDHLILMGDFNDRPGSKVHRELLALFPELYDPWTGLEEASHHSFGQVTWESHRIDWILLDERIRCQEIFLDKTRKGKLWPSDHFPLVCRIKL